MQIAKIPSSKSIDKMGGEGRGMVEYPSYLDTLEKELTPAEFEKFCIYRQQYAAFRRGFAHGARGELSSKDLTKLDDPSSSDPSSSAEHGDTLEDHVIGLFKPPDRKAVKASIGREAALQESLRAVESEFLNAKTVTSQGVTLDEISDRFRKSKVSTEMGSVDQYMTTFCRESVADSVHCNAPAMIGHMTMSLPYYIRPLSKLLTAMHQNNVKTETGKTTTFIEREVLAMLHRSIYPQHGDDFYTEHANNPQSALGLVCSGGTLANISAMWLARNSLMRPDEKTGFMGVEREGLMKATRYILYGHDDAHD